MAYKSRGGVAASGFYVMQRLPFRHRTTRNSVHENDMVLYIAVVWTS